MDLAIDQSWKPFLEKEFEMPYFQNLIDFVNHEYEHEVCYPPQEKIFSAFNHCQFDHVKVVIIGQILTMDQVKLMASVFLLLTEFHTHLRLLIFLKKSKLI